ncbi:type IV secretory system conjugative DNA transfer VirD4/TraG family protein [Neolewinella xylanilytica]|uniref:Type IV secretory system conjugative DNA transfer VirD4/TraG family protein n=2 Tax=Neolewinella xylanilytica TaxID=1514080 RepID=A0A2S6I017_9BACT|nr:type IV secretory system conjugative DNA transfer VirD4/TraG family protein [Neolewinella xylanilytica]
MRKIGLTTLAYFALGSGIATLYTFLWGKDVFPLLLYALILGPLWDDNYTPGGLIDFGFDHYLALRVLTATLFFWNLMTWIAFGSKVRIITIAYFYNKWKAAMAWAFFYMIVLVVYHFQTDESLHRKIITARFLDWNIGYVWQHFLPLMKTPFFITVYTVIVSVFIFERFGYGHGWTKWKWARVLPRIVFVTAPFVLAFLVDELVFTCLVWVFFLPFCLFYAGSLWPIFKELYKEQWWYRRLFVFKRGDTGRWGGLHQYFKRDFIGYFIDGRKEICQSAPCGVYYGKTFFDLDTPINGRAIGTISETHHITIAGTRAGKSRDAIWNTLLSYPGGVIALDIKGEHTRVTQKRRDTVGSGTFYVDPFYISDRHIYPIYGPARKHTHKWNFFDEIDVESPDVRNLLSSLASACIYPESQESGNSAHFRETAVHYLRGIFAHVLTDKQIRAKNLRTVYNLIMTGTEEGSEYDPKNFVDLKIRMLANESLGGLAKDAASLVDRLADREGSAVFSTMRRGIDWMGHEAIQAVTERSDFLLSDAKTHNATIYLVLPEPYLREDNRFVRLFYTMAVYKCDNAVTPIKIEGQKRVLILLDEFASLAYFPPIAKSIKMAAGSYMKYWMILQNVEQLTSAYSNHADFTGSSDMQFFGIKNSDHGTITYIQDSLGKYKEKTEEGTQTYDLMSRNEIAEFLDAEKNGQIVIPDGGLPLMLKRVPYYKNYKSKQYGSHPH